MIRTNIAICVRRKTTARLCAELIPSKVNSGAGMVGVGWKMFLSSDWTLRPEFRRADNLVAVVYPAADIASGAAPQLPGLGDVRKVSQILILHEQDRPV